MAYKFQFGTTKLSGSTTFEEALVGESTISGSGRLSGKELILDAAGVIGTSGDADLMTLTSNKVSVAGDLSASLAVSAKDLLLDATSNIGVDGDTDLITLSANSVVIAGDLSASIALAGKDVLLDDGGKIGVAADTDLLTLTDGIVTVAGDVKAVELSGSSTLSVVGASTFGPGELAKISAAGVFSGSGVSTLSGLTADAATIATATISGGTLSGSVVSGAAGHFLDLFAGDLTVDGAFAASTLSASLGITGSSLEIYAEGGGGVPFFEAQNGILSASGVSTLYSVTSDALIAQTADINGGNIDATVIGASTQAAAEFTTLSASSTLNVVGASNFGPENKVQISAAGVVSGSGNSTLHRLDSNQLVFASGSLNGPMYINKLATTVDEIMGLSSGSLLYHDEATGLQKLGSFSSYALALAGTGITATDGVLSVDTTGGDSMTATHIPLASYGNATLISGINYMSAAATGSCLLVLPSGSAGDVVIVKTNKDISSTNFVKITSSVANANEIDGFSQAIIESPYGAVSLIYVEAGSEDVGQWVIYQAEIVLQFPISFLDVP